MNKKLWMQRLKALWDDTMNLEVDNAQLSKVGLRKFRTPCGVELIGGVI